MFIRPEKSQTERIMEANNQTLLEMLPNGEMYNVANNGRIIRRSQQTDMEQIMELYNNQREDVYSRTYYSNPQPRDQRRSPSNRYAKYEHNNVKYKKRPEQYQRRFADSNNENYSYQQKIATVNNINTTTTRTVNVNIMGTIIAVMTTVDMVIKKTILP